MLTTDIEKVVSALQGIISRDTELITRHVNPSKFIQHNPSVADEKINAGTYLWRAVEPECGRLW